MTKIEKITKTNFLKGILANCENTKKLDFAISFIENNRVLLKDFELAGVLDYAIITNKKTKNIVDAFLKLGYEVANDSKVVEKALEGRHFKTIELVLEKSLYDGSVLDIAFLDKCFHYIKLDSSNDTIEKVLKLIDKIDLEKLNDDSFIYFEKGLLDAKKVLDIVSKDRFSFTEKSEIKMESLMDRFYKIKAFRELSNEFKDTPKASSHRLKI